MFKIINVNKSIGITFLILVFTIIFFSISNTDYIIQNKFYNFTTNSWILNRDEQPYKLIFYDGIKKVLILIALLFIVSIIFLKENKIVKEYRRGFLIVIISAILVPSITGSLKKITNMPCPKNEIHYNGKMKRTMVWEKYNDFYSNMPKIACWPAGHASGGFALLSLFFLFKTKRNKYIAVIGALSIGWSMGIYKMLIGDHFLSHTIITMILSWLIILIVSKVINKKS